MFSSYMAFYEATMQGLAANKVKEINIDNLEVPKPFGLADIYSCRPCHSEFLSLLEYCTENSKSGLFRDTKDIKENPVLYRNLKWLLDKGLLQKE